jgi:hypothetical protein
MTSYIVRHGAQKKKGILEKRETELTHLLKHGAADEKLARAAEKIRAAQKAVIKCMFHETEAVKPEDEARFEKRWRRFEEDRIYWNDIATSDIISQYRDVAQEPEG